MVLWHLNTTPCVLNASELCQDRNGIVFWARNGRHGTRAEIGREQTHSARIGIQWGRKAWDYTERHLEEALHLESGRPSGLAVLQRKQPAAWHGRAVAGIKFKER